MFVLILAVLALVVSSNVAVAQPSGPHKRNPASSNRLTMGLAYGALAWTIIAGAALLLLPTYRGTRTTSTSNTAPVTTTTHQTLLEHEGRSVILVLAVPVALAVVGSVGWPRFERQARIGSGALLTIGCVMSAASIGMFYTPAPLALIAAGLRTSADHRRE